MKKTLLALLFLNLAVFAYVRLVGGPAAVPPAGDAPPIPRLALVGENAAAPAAAAPSCVSIGPFAERAPLLAAGNWLRGLHQEARERSAERDGPPGYWVALATKTLQGANHIEMRLRAAGVTDLEVMPPEAGKTEATVSLGIYSERDRAERRVSDLRHYAVNPVIIEQPRKVAEWWLDVTLAPGSAPPEPAAITLAVPGATGIGVAPCPGAAPVSAPAPAPPPAAAPAPGATPGPKGRAPGTPESPGAPA